MVSQNVVRIRVSNVGNAWLLLHETAFVPCRFESTNIVCSPLRSAKIAPKRAKYIFYGLQGSIFKWPQKLVFFRWVVSRWIGWPKVNQINLVHTNTTQFFCVLCDNDK